MVSDSGADGRKRVRVLCTICARAGSKTIKSKNVYLFAGKPLIVHTIEQAKACRFVDKIVVSTDGEEIAACARRNGAEVPFLRPAELATDNSPKLPVIQHAVRYLLEHGERYDIVIDLDPTAPLRLAADIEAAFRLFIGSTANNLYSVAVARKNPYFNMVELDSSGRSRLSKRAGREFCCRQDAPVVYEMNASIYVYRTRFLLSRKARLHSNNTIVYVMPEERSVHIDTDLDLKVAELLGKEQLNGKKSNS